MKVRCIKLLNAKGEDVSSSPWLKLNAIYDVLELLITPRETSLRVVTEQRTPALRFLQEFELVDERLPENWVVEMRPPGTLYFAPKPWLQRGFWENYFDGDQEAIRIYQEELAKIVKA